MEMLISGQYDSGMEDSDVTEVSYKSTNMIYVLYMIQTCPASINANMAQPVFTAWARFPSRFV